MLNIDSLVKNLNSFAVSISHDYNHYTTSASYIQEVYFF